MPQTLVTFIYGTSKFHDVWYLHSFFFPSLGRYVYDSIRRRGFYKTVYYLVLLLSFILSSYLRIIYRKRNSVLTSYSLIQTRCTVDSTPAIWENSQILGLIGYRRDTMSLGISRYCWYSCSTRSILFYSY